MPENNQHLSTYPVHQYASDPQRATPSSSSQTQGYHTTAYCTSTEDIRRSNPVNINHSFPRPSAFQVDFVNPFDYPDRSISHINNGHITPSLVDPVTWIPSRQGH